MKKVPAWRFNYDGISTNLMYHFDLVNGVWDDFDNGVLVVWP